MIIIIFLYISLILYIGLTPFNLKSKNNVRLSVDSTFVVLNSGNISNKFNPRGIIYSEKNIINEPILNLTNCLTIELVLKTTQFLKNNTSTIMCFFFNGKTIITFEQWYSTFIIQVKDNYSEGSEFKKVGFQNILLKDSTQYITIISDSKDLFFYVNGTLLKKITNFSLTNPDEFNIGKLIMGVSANGQNPWSGEIYGISIFNNNVDSIFVKKRFELWKNHKSVSLFDKNNNTIYPLLKFGKLDYISNKVENYFIIPPYFVTIQKEFFKFKTQDLKDIILNLFGFIPLGFLMFLLSINMQMNNLKRIFIYLLGIILSFFIEYIQGYMYPRDSSLIDLLLNSAGNIIGLNLSNFYYIIKRVFLLLKKKSS